MSTVGVNRRTVVHKGSKGFSIAANDVCNTPTATLGIPVPYVNQGVSMDAINEAFTVYAEGHRVMNASSCFGMTSGDEPGTLGGVISGTFMGKASFANYSYDVYIEGQPTPRAFDPMMQNHGSPYNAFGPAEIQAVLDMSGWEIVCKAICYCANMQLKMVCFRITLAELRFAKGPYGWGPVWDPVLPGVWIEVPYYEGPPPGMYYSDEHSKRHYDDNGNPLPLPAPEYPPPPGSSRPDVVIVKDRTKPPEPGNIKEVYEVKFPPDDFEPGNTQLQRYRRDTGVEPDVATPKLCGCGTGEEEEEPFPLPVPQHQKAKKEAPKREPKKVPERKPWLEPNPPGSKPVHVFTPLEIAVLVGIGLLGILGGGGLIPAPV